MLQVYAFNSCQDDGMYFVDQDYESESSSGEDTSDNDADRCKCFRDFSKLAKKLCEICGKWF